MLSLPIIDLVNDPPEQQAAQIREALGTIGFFEVRNAGLEPERIQRMFDLSKELFAQPKEVKESFPANENGLGYFKPHEQALGVYKRDNKEAFLYGRQSSTTAQPLPPPFADGSTAQGELKAFYRACHETSERLLELFAMALDLPYEHFRQAHSFGKQTATSMIHYPPIAASERDKAIKTDIRSGEHKDWGTLTMLFQLPKGQPGLQVFLPLTYVPNSAPVDTENTSEYSVKGQWGWYDAPLPPLGGFLVNVGLAMELWSGGAYKATLHRVVFPQAAEGEGEGLEGRYTMTCFVQPDDEVVIRPVMGPGSEGAGITSKKLFGGKLKESLERIKGMPPREA